jgi:hypothetical protein
MILARFDPDSQLMYTPEWCLLIAFSLAALAVSSPSPIRGSLREAVLLGFVPTVFALWLLTAIGAPAHNGWDAHMRCGICGAFGLAFSLDLRRHSNGLTRIFGEVCVVLYLLFLFLLIVLPIAT